MTFKLLSALAAAALFTAVLAGCDPEPKQAITDENPPPATGPTLHANKNGPTPALPDAVPPGMANGGQSREPAVIKTHVPTPPAPGTK